MDDLSLHITLKKSGPPGQDSKQALPAWTLKLASFSGTARTVLLAPRGVCWRNGTLLVADTGQNRVFIWKNLQLDAPMPEPDLVLGQMAASETGRNQGETVSASSLQYPSGVWTDGQRLIVADAWNHRVLIWLQFPEQNGQPADVVLGQEDFASNQPNAKGIGAAPDARSLYWPYGVHSDGERLWIADTGNRRVLFYKQIPTENHAAADAVIGKPDFVTRDYESQDPVWPYSVRIGPTGEMAIADTQYFRVLLWNDWTKALSGPADVIIGQPDAESSGANQYGLYPAANTLNWCYDTCFYRQGLLVADTGNSRVLWFEKLPAEHNAAATQLIGKPHFHMGSENAATVLGTDAMMYWPFSLSLDGDVLALADTGNHRILFYQLNPSPQDLPL